MNYPENQNTDFQRYSRLEALPGIGREGLSRIRNAKVLVVGCGALGSLCSMELAASGIGHIAIADFDTIEVSNLQRQLFFRTDETGAPKADTLAERMRALNPGVEVEVIPMMITPEIAETLFPRFDFVVDGSDNPHTKQMTDSICRRLGIPYCIGGVREYGGQVMSWAPGKASWADIFGSIPDDTDRKARPVLGPAAAVAASVQASEAIKHCAGTGGMLHNRLLLFDLAAPYMKTLEI